MATDPQSMDCDSMFYVVGPAGPRVRRFLDEWLVRWPDMLVNITDREYDPVDGMEDGSQPWRAVRDLLPVHAGTVFAMRDAAMDEFSDEWAFALDGRGEGPVQFVYGACGREARRFTFKETPEMGEHDAVFALEGMSWIDAVTPDTDAPFVKIVLEWFGVSLLRPLAT